MRLSGTSWFTLATCVLAIAALANGVVNGALLDWLFFVSLTGIAYGSLRDRYRARLKP
jgi:hypothetical protein